MKKRIFMELSQRQPGDFWLLTTPWAPQLCIAKRTIPELLVSAGQELLVLAYSFAERSMNSKDRLAPMFDEDRDMLLVSRAHLQAIFDAASRSETDTETASAVSPAIEEIRRILNDEEELPF